MTCDCGNELLAGKCYCARCFELDGHVGEVGSRAAKMKGPDALLEVIIEPMSLSEIADGTGISKRHVQRLTRSMFQTGAINRRIRDTDCGAWEYVYWRVL